MSRYQDISKVLTLTTQLRSVGTISAIGEGKCQIAWGYAACPSGNQN